MAVVPGVLSAETWHLIDVLYDIITDNISLFVNNGKQF